jgi:hypothetical protein
MAKAKKTVLNPQAEEIAEIKWVDVGHAVNVLTYDNDKAIIGKIKKAVRD